MNMRNALQELIQATAIGGSPKVPHYGVISWEPYYVKNSKHIRVEFRTPDEFARVRGQLDFEYDGGYGTQELFGTVVFTDGSWLTRWEYDGSEGWSLNECPRFTDVFPPQPLALPSPDYEIIEEESN